MTGVQMQEVRDALRDAFDLVALDQMLRFRLSIVRRNIVADGPLNTVAFQLLDVAQMEGWETALVEAAYRERPRNPKIREVYQKYGLAPHGEFPVQPAELERIIRESNAMLNMAEWCERAAKIQDRVCRIELQGNPMGTGFLVGPEVVLTNYHVMEQTIKGQIPPSAVTLRFDYKQLADGTILSGGMHRLADDWRIDASPYSAQDLQGLPDDAARDPKELDYALLRVAGAPGNQKVDQKGSDDAPVRGWISVPETEVTFAPNHPLFIVQHPQGTPLKLALDTQAVIAVNANRTRVRYKTNTEPGSSGSPCFDQHWELVALHHLGDPNFHAKYNQGIPIAAIRDLLKERGKDNHLGSDAP